MPSIPPEARRQSNTLGIALMALAVFFFAGADTVAKFLAGAYHPLQVAGMRQVGLVGGVLLWLMLRGTAELRTRQPKMQILRGLCAGVSASLFVISLRYIPLTDATTIAFVAPFFVTILGAILLKEPIGPRRWFAIVAGFSGTLVVMRPGFAAFHPAYLLVMGSAFLFAVRQVISRNLARTETTLATVAFTAGVSAALLGLVQPFVWEPIARDHIVLFVMYGAFAAMGEFLVIKALEIALAVVVAPLQYTMILWTSFFGYSVFGHVPDGFTILGSVIIITSGGFTLWREHQIGKRRAEEARLSAEVPPGSPQE